MQTKCPNCDDMHVCHADQDQFFMERLQSMAAAESEAEIETRSDSQLSRSMEHLYRGRMLIEVMEIFEQMHPGSGEKYWPEVKP